MDRAHGGRHVHGEGIRVFIQERLYGFGHVLDELSHIECFEKHFHAASFNFGEVENVVDQAK